MRGCDCGILETMRKGDAALKPFLNEDFLLKTPTARQLYHEYAENMPIVDYHCHVSPREIYEDRHFDNLAEARYTVPDVWTMGKVYARLIEDVSDEDNIVETILQVFTSWIDGLLSDYNAAFYYQPRDYIAECYRQKTVLDG